jgi:MOSC domain-containing protein YiiM
MSDAVPGKLVAIHLAPAAGVPLVAVESVTAVAGRGLTGDRYFEKSGTFSDHAVTTGRDVTLVEMEALEAVAREEGFTLAPAETRRNLATRGVRLNDLVGRRFRVGDVLLEGVRLCEPCAHLESLTRPGVLKAFVHRCGLRANIVTGGELRVGDTIAPV